MTTNTLKVDLPSSPQLLESTALGTLKMAIGSEALGDRLSADRLYKTAYEIFIDIGDSYRAACTMYRRGLMFGKYGLEKAHTSKRVKDKICRVALNILKTSASEFLACNAPHSPKKGMFK